MTIEFQYFSGCPHSQQTLENLKSLVKSGFITEDELIIVEVNNPDRARELNFQGSPTILCDGIDIYSMEKPRGFSFSCRVYNIDGTQTGVLPVDFIKRQIEKLRRRS